MTMHTSCKSLHTPNSHSSDACFIPLTFLPPGGHLRESLNKVATGRAGGSNAGPDAGHVLCKKGIWERDLVYEGAVIAPEALAAAPTVASFFHGGGAAALAAALAAAFPAAGVSGLCTMKVQLNTGEGEGCLSSRSVLLPSKFRVSLWGESSP